MTEIDNFESFIGKLNVAQTLRDCDLIFGCTDDEWGRAILTKLAINYLIPVIDMGVKIDSTAGVIRSVRGRVTHLGIGYPCLFCRETITSEGVLSDFLKSTNPEEYRRRVREGYVPELEHAAPAIIPYTTATASAAVSELLNKLTLFMGMDRQSSEVILKFDECRTTTTARPRKRDCWCGALHERATGDRQLFLGLTWPA